MSHKKTKHSAKSFEKNESSKIEISAPTNVRHGVQMIWDQEKGLVGTNVPSEWQFLLKYTGSTSLHEPGTAKYVANSGAYPPGNPHAHQQPQHLNQPGQVGQMPTGYQSGYPSTSQTQPSATYDYQGYPSQTSQQGQVGQLPSGYPSNSQSVGGQGISTGTPVNPSSQGYPPGYPQQQPQRFNQPGQVGQMPTGYPSNSQSVSGQGIPTAIPVSQSNQPLSFNSPAFQNFMRANPQFAPFKLSPNVEKEPMLLLDITGSMNYGTSETDQTPRRETVREALGIIVETLGREDSQAVHEQGPGQEGGGLRTVTFAGGRAEDLGDLNPGNLNQKWARIKWAGGTRIMPGWRKLIEVYMDEFGSRPEAERPILMALIITDGDADDCAEFATELQRLNASNVFVTLAIVGYGAEHDAALRTYKQIESNNAHVKVLSFGSETNPEIIARALLKMIE